ncbi:RICIN domain-containing protein [Streptomyces aureus]|uniref:RICIN domain-containing protein n=1 Tax=Streptomyces aureus TaxID=193461 RepID=UPI0033E621F5
MKGTIAAPTSPGPSRSPSPSHSSTAAAARPEPLTYAYIGTRSGLCLDVPYSSRAEGTQLQIWPCTGNSNQQFTYTTAHELRVYGDRCLTAGAAATGSGTPVVIAPCTVDAHQRWQPSADGTIRQAGLCVDVTYGTNDPGAPVEMWDCTLSGNQLWSREPADQ